VVGAGYTHAEGNRRAWRNGRVSSKTLGVQSQVQFPGPDFLSRESGHLGFVPRLVGRSSN
jgi:hypothetical protein